MNPTEQIQALELRRRSAMVEADVPTLSALFADDLCWVHANARVDSKAAVLASLESGRSKYLSIECAEETVRCYDTMAVVNGIARMKAEIAGAPRLLENRFTVLWHQTAPGHWQVVHWQSTSVPKV